MFSKQRKRLHRKQGLRYLPIINQLKPTNIFSRRPISPFFIGLGTHHSIVMHNVFPWWHQTRPAARQITNKVWIISPTLTYFRTDINIEIPSIENQNEETQVELEKPVVNVQFLQRRDRIVGIVLWSFSLLYHVVLLLSKKIFYKICDFL